MTARIDLRRDLDGDPGSPALRVEMTSRGSTLVLALLGEARVWDAGVLEGALSRVLVARPRDIVVDLSACSMLSSVAVARLIDMAQVARRAGGRVRLAALQPNVREVVRTLRLEQLFPLHGTVAEALGATLRRSSA